MLSDGPFVETKEHVAGLWIMEAPDLDVALKLAAEGRRRATAARGAAVPVSVVDVRD